MYKYNIEYINENEFRKLERSIRKYDKVVYRKLIFLYYPKLKSGEFVGDVVSINKHEKTETYELELPTNRMFSKIHGNIIFKYKVDKKNKVIIFETFEPHDVLMEGHNSGLDNYKGFFISKSHAEKDRFKIDLLNSYQNDYNFKPVSYNKSKPITTPKKDKIKDLEKEKVDFIDKKIECIDRTDDVKIEVDNNYSKKNLEKNSDFKINPHLRYYAIKKIFDEVDEEIRPQLTKYYINKDKIEFSNSYIAFVLNNISDRFKKGYNIPFNIQKIINDTRFSNPYRQVYINFDDFYDEHDYAFKTEDEYFYYKIEDVEVNGYYLKHVFDILGHSIKIEISNKYKPVLFTNSDGEQAILLPIKRI